MLERAVSRAVEALNAAGISAGAAYPKTAAEPLRGGFVRVGAGGAESRSPGFGRYLGVETDPETGPREVYGLRCDFSLSLDVYAPRSEDNAATACAVLFDRAAAVLGASRELGLREIRCGAPEPDPVTGMFRLSGSLRCGGLLSLAAGEDGEAPGFTEFVLRGELRGR